jgi:uncharacterized protein (DUF1697 family)
MPRYIAFLRAINVGGHTVAMSRLRELFVEAGVTDVETFIASGNVSFTTRARNPDSLERRLATHLHTALGFEVETFLRTPRDLARAMAATPFGDAEVASAHALMVGFVATAPDHATRDRVSALSGASDALRVVDRELYWLRRTRESEPALSRGIEKALGVAMTVRNATTLRRLLTKYGDPAPRD